MNNRALYDQVVEEIRGGYMGFISAVKAISQMDKSSGIEQQLKFPLETSGGMIRVFLDVDEAGAQPLHVKGVKKVDVADFLADPDMKRKYLWKDRVGSNVFWGFTPIYKSGKPPAREEKRKEAFYGKDGDWSHDKDCHLYKLRARVLDDYEKEGAFTEGSVDRIMRDLPGRLEEQLGSLDKKKSYIVIFGVTDASGDKFIYPGEIPCFVSYFNSKLSKVFQLDNEPSAGNLPGDQHKCALCGKGGKTTTLDKVFKFSTYDKVSILPGLDKAQKERIFPICMDCQAQLSAGRAYIERYLTNASAIGGIRIWAVPEEVENGYSSGRFQLLVRNLIDSFNRDGIGSPGQNIEEKYFHRLANEGQGLIFHFLFWEQNNSQELVHLMVEDVPPERLVFLEKSWRKAVSVIKPELAHEADLDLCIKSLYKTLYNLAGESKAERSVLRDFVLEVMKHLLSGTSAPLEGFKQVVVSRIPGLVHQTEKWSEVMDTLNYATAWVEFMSIVNSRL